MPAFGSKFIFPVDGMVDATNLADTFNTQITEQNGKENRLSRWGGSRMEINIGA